MFKVSIDKVKNEIMRGSDELAVWCSEITRPDFFMTTDDISINKQYRDIITWVMSQKQFKDEAKNLHY